MHLKLKKRIAHKSVKCHCLVPETKTKMIYLYTSFLEIHHLERIFSTIPKTIGCFSSPISKGPHTQAGTCVYGQCASVCLGRRGGPCPPAIAAPCPVQGGIHLLAWTVSLSGTARSYGALQALSTVISRFTSDFQSQARIVGWEAVIKKPLHGHISCSSLSYVSRC